MTFPYRRSHAFDAQRSFRLPPVVTCSTRWHVVARERLRCSAPLALYAICMSHSPARTYTALTGFARPRALSLSFVGVSLFLKPTIRRIFDRRFARTKLPHILSTPVRAKTAIGAGPLRSAHGSKQSAMERACAAARHSRAKGTRKLEAKLGVHSTISRRIFEAC